MKKEQIRKVTDDSSITKIGNKNLFFFQLSYPNLYLILCCYKSIKEHMYRSSPLQLIFTGCSFPLATRTSNVFLSPVTTTEIRPVRSSTKKIQHGNIHLRPEVKNKYLLGVNAHYWGLLES